MLSAQCNGTPFEVLPALDLYCGEDRYVPDVVLYRKDAEFKNDVLNEGAAIAVEIMSPRLTIGRLFEKAEVFVQRCTSCSWIVWPKRKQAWIYTKDLLNECLLAESGSLTASAEGVEFKVFLATLFEGI